MSIKTVHVSSIKGRDKKEKKREMKGWKLKVLQGEQRKKRTLWDW